MTNVKARERNLVTTAVGLLAALYAATFLVAVLLHMGIQIPLGFAVLEEPRRPIAVIVEGRPDSFWRWVRLPSSRARPGRGPR